MRTTCIQHPTREPLLIIRQWQLDFCEGNHCAAALLSQFEYWHNIRLDLNEQAQQANAVAHKHGQPATQAESLLQFHSDEQLQAGLLDLYGTKKIREARHLLVVKGAITEHPNPNPRYAFDKTLYFQFHPEVLNAWLDQRRNAPATNAAPADEHNPFSDQNASSKDSGNNNVTCGKNAERVGKNADSYTEITYEITSETTTTPLPPSFTKHAQRSLQPEGSSGGDGEKPKNGLARLVFDGPLMNLSTVQQERARQIVSPLDPDTAQQVLDDWGQAIKTGNIRKSKWAWLDSVARRAQAGAFTPTTDAAERRQAEKRHRDAQEASIPRIPTQPLPVLENRPKARPVGLQALLDAISPRPGRAE
jgi:hypothetical protein